MAIKMNVVDVRHVLIFVLKQAIHMEYDIKGYLYPVISEDLCIDCKLCEKVCPLKAEKEESLFEKKSIWSKK